MLKLLIRSFFILLVCYLIGNSCKQSSKANYKWNPNGYYHRLIAFAPASSTPLKGQIAWLRVSFKNQADSVFWDSYNNYNDVFFVEINKDVKENLFQKSVASCNEFDSVCILIKPDLFFKQQFNSSTLPYFSINDTVVKINYRIKKIMSQEALAKQRLNFEKQESVLIEAFFKTPQVFEQSRDVLGFYWVQKPQTNTGDMAEPGDLIRIQYTGTYLNGRFLEQSPEPMEFIYGSPDQLLKGLNFVIGLLKVGQTAKIIVPSRLAFGANGSSNGTVPPYTPLLYSLTLKDIKKTK